MDTHEFQAKTILKHYGIPCPPFHVIENIEELQELIKQEGDKPSYVLKIQVHAGGRGKGGGIKFVKTQKELFKEANQLLGMRLVNRQTGPKGIIANHLMVTEMTQFVKEYYLGIIIDRQSAQPILIASPEGGMEIEEVAKNSPEKVLTLPICLSGFLRGYQLIRLSKFMEWTGETAQQGHQIANSMVKAFLDSDASLLEINPLVKCENGDLLALDAKLSIDDNALFRHPDLEALYDPSQLPPLEVEARKHDLAYIALDGSIGCMVNGAGLAMATMDIIQHYGGKPANFLDVGGGASVEKVAAGFKILIEDNNVKAILVNIFGGIMNCETLAKGILSAAQNSKLSKPIIIRMEGTHVEQGRELLENSNLKITVAKTLTEAAQKVVAAI